MADRMAGERTDMPKMIEPIRDYTKALKSIKVFYLPTDALYISLRKH